MRFSWAYQVEMKGRASSVELCSRNLYVVINPTMDGTVDVYIETTVKSSWADKTKREKDSISLRAKSKVYRDRKREKNEQRTTNRVYRRVWYPISISMFTIWYDTTLSLRMPMLTLKDITQTYRCFSIIQLTICIERFQFIFIFKS